MIEKISFEALEKAIDTLGRVLNEQAKIPEMEVGRMGVIQCFEITMDISRQLLNRVLKEIFNMPELTARKDTFREAAKLELIKEAEVWISYVNARNATSHTYNRQQAEKVFHLIPNFLIDAQDLLKSLKKL